MPLAPFRIIFIDVAQRLQNITARFREVRGNFYKLPSCRTTTAGAGKAFGRAI
jgi:hypothetical protein